MKTPRLNKQQKREQAVIDLLNQMSSLFTKKQDNEKQKDR